MSAFKGTPGPWAWGHNSASSDVIYCIEVTAKGGIGSVAYLQSYTADDYDDRAETIANARLIAAAPELLEVAQRSADALRSAGIEPRATSDNPLEWLLHQTEAAIAKATGEQP